MKTKKINMPMSILKNVQMLYFVFFLSLINVVWLVYYNKIKSIIIFASCCLAFYLINKNMIFVLGLSLVIVNIASLVNTKEGYKNKRKSEKVEDDDDDDDNDDTDEKEAFKHDEEDDKLEKLKKLYKSKLDEEQEQEEQEDEESNFMQDKKLMNKIKKIDPDMFNKIKNLNSLDIDKINKTINQITNKVKDP